MEFLADEKFPGPSVTLLRKAGFTAVSVAEKMSWISQIGEFWNMPFSTS